MRRLFMVLGLGAVVSLGVVVYPLLPALNPAPLPAQIYPYGTSEVPTSAPQVVHVEYDTLVEQVIPAAGRTVDVTWGDMGQRLVESGAVDLAKFEELYGGLTPEQQEILQGDSLQEITFTADNIQFWTNVLWAFGLTQHSQVLSDGPMMENSEEIPLGNYASTGGWDLGSVDAVDLYNSTDLITLTPEQDERIYIVSENIFRPCCGNPTVFPDCNHGMAVLGLLELMAAQGADDEAMYQAALAFNSYAFPSTYITLAAYFAGQDTDWADVSPVIALGPSYSSGQGFQRIAALVGPIPGAPAQGGSCST